MKSKEEQAKEKYPISDDYQDLGGVMQKSFVEGYTACAKDMEREWISVTERLPEIGVKVLALHYPKTPTMDGKLIYGFDQQYNLEDIQKLPQEYSRRIIENGGFLNRVAYWQPLPSPPQSTEKGGEVI